MTRRLFVFLSLAISAADAQSPGVLPVDEATRDSGLVAFRRDVLAALARDDTAAVLASFSPQVTLDLGGGEGIAVLRERLRERDVWRELVEVLSNGGRFEVDSTFYAPWWFHVDLDDPFDQWVVIGDGVRMREAPRASAAVVATLPRMVVSDDSAATADPDWVPIRLPDGRRGFVAARFLRRTVGYRVGIRREGGRWRIVAFLAGDCDGGSPRPSLGAPGYPAGIASRSPRARCTPMDEDKFNLDVRKFLKHFGVTAQREIEKAVAAGIATGRLKGTETIKARAVLEIEGFGRLEAIEDDIHLA